MSAGAAETITPPNPLAKAKSGDGPVKIDPNVLREAEQAVDELQGDYPIWAQKDIDGLREAMALGKKGPDTLPQAIADIYKYALDLKGQGGGFGYDLITSIGDLLTKFMEERDQVSHRDFEIICAHVDAMQAVIRQDIKGDGGKIGNQIVDGLSELVLKTG
tara:strand:+ start:2175 stop:2657 length:483 start_codon:yes stop_codon:yes gene_type:complete